MSFIVGKGSQSAETVAVPPSRTFFVTGEAPNRYLSFKGSWEIEGDAKTAFKAAATHYICAEYQEHCTAAETVVYRNSLLVENRGSLDAEWEAGRVVIHEPFAECRVATTIADLTTQEVFQIVTDRPDRSAEFCGGLESLTEPRRVRLIDGSRRYFDAKFPPKD